MERWLSKSRVLLGLCAVLLIAALNRQDPMVYAMFLLLAVLSCLGFVLPWLSLRSISIQLEGDAEIVVLEGAEFGLNLKIKKTSLWPSFMVDVETEWEWADKRFVLTQTIPIIRAGRSPDTEQWVRFSCRGCYALVSVRLTSGFPLGLIRVSQTFKRPNIHLRVLPQAQLVHWPLPWNITEDLQGERTTRRLESSFELGTLRPYQYGEFVGRVNWRASARIGELVIQYFQQQGSVRLRVVAEVPRGDSLGQATGSGEQAIRLCAGVCQAALAQSAQLFLYLEHIGEPVQVTSELLPALAQAMPSPLGFFPLLERAAIDSRQGEQIAVVINTNCAAEALLLTLDNFKARGCQVLVCIALGIRMTPAEHQQALGLQTSLERNGFFTWMEMP